MKRRSGKYLNAREYAERLRLSDNKDIQDFAEDFLDALDIDDELELLQSKIDDNVEDPAARKTYVEDIEWLGNRSSSLDEIESLVETKCPEYKDWEIEKVIADLISRRRPMMVYDL